MKTVAIVSGGMDSVAMAYGLVKGEGHQLVILSFDYGQRHRKEIHYARLCAERLGARHEVVDLTGLNRLIGGSSLTDPSIAVPDGHYAEETMRITVVPNRNAIMLSIAYGLAVAENAEAVAIAVHSGDHFIYPDCRPAFLNSFEEMETHATQGFGNPYLRLRHPFSELTKADIVKAGEAWSVPWHETWSCYKGGEVHCGTCGTCVERREAFQLAGVKDPTDYLEVNP